MNENTLVLDPNVKAKVEAELGESIPDPNGLEFQSFLEDLQSNHPDLFEEVMQGISVDIDFPAEQQAQKAARRENLYSLFKRTFFRRSAVDGEPVAAKRRWLMYTFGALAVLGPVLYLLGQSFGSGQDNAAPAQQTIVEPEPFDVVQPTAPLAQVQELPEETPEPTPPPAPVPPRAPTPAPEPQRNTPPPPTPPRPVQAPAPPAPAAPAPAAPAEVPVVRPNTLTLFEQNVPPPPTMSIFDEKQTRETELLPLEIFNDESTSDTLLIAQSEDTASTSLTIPIGENPNAVDRPTQLRIDQPETNEPSGNEDTSLPPPPTDTATADAENTETLENNEEAAEPKVEMLADFLPAGSRLSARLTTGIAVTAGASTPVVATSDENWCTTPPCNEITWLGEATLDGSSRVQINFTQAVYKDNLQSVTALALGAGNTPGLTAAVKDTTPTLAQDILRSAVGGFSDYVGALQNQNTVTIIDGVALSETQAPPLDAFLLGRIGDLLALPQDNTPIVRVAEVAADSQLVVLFGVPLGGATPQNVE